tara:strand:- start:920 stop:1702 length:783 start_codon:yes stop_codon:yes gene_type:complete
MERMSLEFIENIAILKFNHPEVMNAVGVQMLEDFSEAVREIQDPANGARCMLLTGEGRGFCAGANLQDPERGKRKGGSGDGLRGSYHPLLLTLRDLDIPIVTAVNGAAAGIGMSFALLGDLVCASKDAFFLQAFARIGLVPDGGSTFMLPRMVGWSRALEMSLLAERVSAEQGMEWGLVNRVFENNELLMDGALSLARKLAKGPKSLSLIRQAYWSTWHNSFEQQIDLEARLQNQAASSEDNKEGIAAFLEKRDANFTGS